MDNAYLAAEAKRELTERTRAQDALRVLNATLEREVAERTEQLRLNEEALRQSQKMEASVSSPEAWHTISTTFCRSLWAIWS